MENKKHQRIADFDKDQVIIQYEITQRKNAGFILREWKLEN
jgi:hypothetical protein